MSKTIAIHQPNYLPWLGYFYKIVHADEFVFLDSAEISLPSYVNSCRIKTLQGELKLTVPLKHIQEKQISDQQIATTEWRKKHLASIYHAYHDAEYFDEVFYLIEPILKKDFRLLADLNIALIQSILNYLNIEKKIVRSSALPLLSKKASARLIEICRVMNADSYLSGAGGKNYNDEQLFETEKIMLRYSSFREQSRSQLRGPFIAGLSSIDALFIYGKKAIQWLN